MSPLEYLIIYIIDNSPISVDMGCNKGLSSVLCSFEFTNNANEDLYLLKRDTPLEGLVSPFIALYHNGDPVPYEGPLVYRLPPTEDEFLLMKSGERVTASVHINDVFNIDTDGHYIVRYSKPLRYISAKDGINGEVSETLVYESVYIYLEDTRHLSKPTPQEEEEEGKSYTVHLQSCTSATFVGGNNQNDQTLAAHKKLCGQIAVATGKVGNNQLYITWFGAYNTTRVSSVKKVYKKCGDGLKSKTVTYSNTGSLCKPNYIAYTYKGTTKVYLCPYYFNQPTFCNKNAYTKEATLIHEWAHAFGYTDDHKYGATNCMNLAKTDPDKAIDNADNYRFHYCNSY